MQGLVRDSGLQLRNGLLTRVSANAGDLGGAVLLTGKKHRAGFKKGEIPEAARNIAAQRIQKPRQDAGTQRGVLAGNRVHQPDHRHGLLRLLGSAEQGIGLLGQERIGQHLRQSCRSQT